MWRMYNFVENFEKLVWIGLIPGFSKVEVRFTAGFIHGISFEFTGA